MLITRAMKIFDKDHFQKEMKHLRKALKDNGYKYWLTSKVFHRAQHPTRTPNHNNLEVLQKVFLPYIEGVIDNISRTLRRKYIKALHHSLLLALFENYSDW